MSTPFDRIPPYRPGEYDNTHSIHFPNLRVKLEGHCNRDPNALGDGEFLGNKRSAELAVQAINAGDFDDALYYLREILELPKELLPQLDTDNLDQDLNHCPESQRNRCQRAVAGIIEGKYQEVEELLLSLLKESNTYHR